MEKLGLLQELRERLTPRRTHRHQHFHSYHPPLTSSSIRTACWQLGPEDPHGQWQVEPRQGAPPHLYIMMIGALVLARKDKDDEILPLFTFSPTLLDSHRCNGIFNQVKFLTIYLWCLWWWWSASGKFLWSRSTWSMETQPLSPDLTPTPGLTLTFVTILYLCIGLYYLIYIVPVSMCSCVHVDHRRR